MMNCREGLTLRANGAARSDWKIKAGNINMQIARQVVFIGWLADNNRGRDEPASTNWQGDFSLVDGKIPRLSPFWSV
jgi:hypothetical protein